MFARLTTIRMKGDRQEEFVKTYEERVIPAARLQKGYRGAYLLTDRTTNRDRGRPHGRRPPTPPDIRVRIRRFESS